jgi:cysteine synthase
MSEIEVVRNLELKNGDSTERISREKAFEGRRVLSARSRIAGGVSSGWQYHRT